MDKNALVFVAGNPFMIGITGYSMLRIGRTIAIQGIDHLWVVMVQKDAIFIDLLQFVPLLTGILLAAVQFSLRCNASV